MKINFIIFCFLFLSLCPSLQAKPIKITTWNIEWLLSSSDIKNYKIPTDVRIRRPEDYIRLNYYINKLNSDIIALQEIGSIDTAKHIFPPNQYYFFISQDKIAQHPFLAIRKTLPFRIKQNSDLVTLSKVNTNHTLRSAIDLTLYHNKANLRILVVHLKSRCQDKPLTNSKSACADLRKQQIVLQQWIIKRNKEKQPFIILGDFNRILSLHDAFFSSLSPSFPITIPTTGFASPCWGGNYFIDGFILNQQAGQWFIKRSLKVMVYKEKQFKDQLHLSDHCPVSIELSLP